MVGTAEGAKNIFILVEQIQIEEIQNQSHGYFRLLGIRNVSINPLKSPLVVSAITHVSDNHGNL